MTERKICFDTVILAAGLGKRMKTSTPKFLHKILGKPLVNYVAEAAEAAGSRRMAAVVGLGADEVRKALESHEQIQYYIQEKQLGTGHAVMTASDFIPDSGSVVILQGDTPFTSAETIRALAELHENEKNGITLVSATVDNPHGYGRLVRSDNGGFAKIVEERDANESERKIKEINAGVYCAEAKALKAALKMLRNDNAQNEYYFTDVLEIIKSGGGKVGILHAEDADEFMGINTVSQLAAAAEHMKLKIAEAHMAAGVVFYNPNSAYISPEVKIGADTVIYPNTIIEGNTIIGSGCKIGPNTTITDAIIGDGTSVSDSVVKGSKVGENSSLGPFAYLRPGTVIGNHVRVGDFVEIKNSNIGDGTKISHLAYVGDSDVGKNVNYSCGAITGNYDGKNKHRTVIEDDAFIGCNTNLVAPVKVGKGAFTAAGSTITNDVPDNALAVARARQTEIPGWALRRK